MTAKPVLLTAATDLRTPTTSQLFSGRDHGVDVSFFLNHTRPGAEVSPHRHPYPEVFVLQDGEATFLVDGEPIAARGGHVVVVPARATHGFRNTGGGTLEMISIHPAAEMQTDWVDRP
jgi:quercetin dioxygenase-like cupin family protein